MRKLTSWMLVLLAAASVAYADRPVDETRAAAADARISIDTVAGSLTISGWDAAEMRVTGTLGDDVEDLEISGGPGDLSIRVKIPKGEYRGRRDIRADLEVRVPRGCRLEVDSVSSGVEIGGLTGSAEVDTVSGQVTVSDAPEVAQLASVSGRIHLEGDSTRVTAESVSGAIHLAGVAGRIEAETVSGTVEIVAHSVDSIELGSVAGSVSFAGRLARNARLEVEVHSGNVVLSLPSDTSARFDVSSFSGRIRNEFGPEAERTSRYGPGMSLEFETGGDATVVVDTFSGNVTLQRD